MFFLIGLFLGALGGAVAQFLTGTPLLVGKGLDCSGVIAGSGGPSRSYWLSLSVGIGPTHQIVIGIPPINCRKGFCCIEMLESQSVLDWSG